MRAQVPSPRFNRVRRGSKFAQENCASSRLWIPRRGTGKAGNLRGKKCEAPDPRLEGDHMNRVTSSDGTTIAFDRLGDGSPLILVCGGSTDRMANTPLARLLAPHFTVLNYDRRGRGDSGDRSEERRVGKEWRSRWSPV